MFFQLRSANTRNKISSWSDKPAVILCSQFSKQKQTKYAAERERESVRACVRVLDKVGNRVFTSRALGIVFVALSVSDWFQ